MDTGAPHDNFIESNLLKRLLMISFLRINKIFTYVRFRPHYRILLTRIDTSERPEELDSNCLDQ